MHRMAAHSGLKEKIHEAHFIEVGPHSFTISQEGRGYRQEIYPKANDTTTFCIVDMPRGHNVHLDYKVR